MRWMDAQVPGELEVTDPLAVSTDDTTVEDFMTALKAAYGFVEDAGPTN